MASRKWKDGVITGPDQAIVDEVVEQLALQEAKHRATIERWGTGGHERMSRLAKRFPTLRGAIGVEPWDAIELLRWCASGALTTGSRHAAAFVLQVWNSSADWAEEARAAGIDVRLPPFNVVEALGQWDDQHTAAFMAWAELPFWP